MRWPLLATLGASLGAIAGVSVLVAQTVEGLDIAAIKQRAARQSADAEALAEHVKNRGDVFREEALKIAGESGRNLAQLNVTALPKAAAGAVDFDEIVAGAVRNTNQSRGDAPQFIVFASLSMPRPALKQLVADTTRANGFVVFRGFPDNSARTFSTALAQVIDRGQNTSNIGVDPRLFRAFAVEVVPTFIAVGSDFDLCDGFSCRTAPPPHDRLAGNVTVAYALETIVEGRGPGAGVAAAGLANLERNPR